MSHVTVRSYEPFVSIIAQFLFLFAAVLLHLLGGYIGTVEVRNFVCGRFGRFLHSCFDHIKLLSDKCSSVTFHRYITALVGV